jgi:hypothetical protein
MDESKQIFRLKIDGKWTADDMARSFSHLRDLYNFRLMTRIIFEDQRQFDRMFLDYFEPSPYRRRYFRRLWLSSISHSTVPLSSDQLSDLASQVFPDEQLQVNRVKYGSEGFKDFAGIGEVVKQLKELLMFWLDRKHRREENLLKNEKLQVETDGLRIQNARAFAALRQESVEADQRERLDGILREDLEKRRSITWVDERQGTFIQLIDQGKITGVEIVGDNDQ